MFFNTFEPSFLAHNLIKIITNYVLFECLLSLQGKKYVTIKTLLVFPLFFVCVFPRPKITSTTQSNFYAVNLQTFAHTEEKAFKLSNFVLAQLYLMCI